MGYSFGQGLLDFATGVSERAREYDTEEAKRINRLAEIKAKRQDELLKTRWTDAKKKRDADITKIDAITSAGGIDSIEGQAIAKGYDINNIKKMLEAKAAAGDAWKWSDMPVAGEEPTLQYSDEEAIATSMKKQQGSTLGTLLEDLNLKETSSQKGGELTEEDLGKASSYRRGEAIKLTTEQKDAMSKWSSKIYDDKLDIVKKAEYHFSNYSNPELFPEYVNASPAALKRLAYDVAVGTVKVTPEGMPWDIRRETVSSYANDLFKKTVTATEIPTEIPTKTSTDVEDGYVPLEIRKATKEDEDKAKKVAQEEIKIQRTQPAKMSNVDVKNAKKYLKSATFTTTKGDVKFRDELSTADQGAIDISVAGDVNAIVAQTRMSPAEATRLATELAKTGLEYTEHNLLTDGFTNDFTYSEPAITWQDVLDTYNKYKVTRPNITYTEVLNKLTEQQGK